MMRYISILGCFLIHITAFANGGNFFNVAKSGSALLVSTTIQNHTYPNAGIRLNTPGFSISNPSSVCAAVVNNFCLFSVNNISAKSIPYSGSGSIFTATICLNGKAQLSCQDYQFSNSLPQRFAYVSNFNRDSVSLCNINAETGFLSGCNTTGSGFSAPTDVVFNPNGTRAYVTNYENNTVTVCTFDNGSGALSNCSGAATFPNGSNPQGIAFNPAGTRAYVLGCDELIKNCSVNQVTGALEDCINTAPIELDVPTDIIINSAGTLAYITNRGDSTVLLCPIDADTGLIQTCTSTGSEFDLPEGIAFNSTENLVYVGNDYSNSVTYCAVSPTDGTLSNCQLTGGDFDGFGNVTLNINDTFAYVPNSYSNTVSICSVNSSNGELSDCVDSEGTGFSEPTAVMLHE